MVVSLLTLLLPLVLLCQHNVANAEQFALRPQSKEQLQSRSLASSLALFNPTSVESFHTVGDDPSLVHTTIHKHPKSRFVNFERFEEYLRPQKRLCTPSPNNRSVVLSFPLDHPHYHAARVAWQGKKNLVFMGHDPSCFAQSEQRSSFRSLSIAFDDASRTVLVTGKPLAFGEKHFPAPSELIIGSAPSDVILFRRRPHAKRGRLAKRSLHCIISLHPWHCLKESLEEELDKGLKFDFQSPNKTINFKNTENKEAKKKYWPPQKLDGTGVPPIFEVYCLECETAGAMQQVLSIEFVPMSPIDDDDDEDNDEEDVDTRLSRRDDTYEDSHGRHDKQGQHDHLGQEFKDHVKRTVVRYTVTEEIRLRKQIQIKTSLGVDGYCSIPVPGLALPGGTAACGKYITGGGLTWEPGAAPEDQQAVAAAQGPKIVGDPKAGSGISHFGYTVWPMDIGVYLWINFGISTKANVILPGVEATIAKGSVMVVEISGKDKGIIKKFEPVIELVKPDLSIHNTEIHFNVAIGPKAGLNIGLPMGKLGVGLGAKLDIIRIDNKLAEYDNVTSSCAVPKQREEAIEHALGYTMDVKTGFYAYFNLAGFFIDSSWLGDKNKDGIPGLYWGIKNLIAKCVSCGNETCPEQVADKVLGIVEKGFESLFGDGFEEMSGKQKAAVTNLKDSEHKSKDGINSLDNSIAGMDMPTGDPNISIFPRNKLCPDEEMLMVKQFSAMQRRTGHLSNTSVDYGNHFLTSSGVKS